MDGINKEPVAEVGDIVSCDGYGSEKFEVESYTIEHYKDAEGAEEDLFYVLVPLGSSSERFIVGYEEDVIVVCRSRYAASYADYYLRQRGAGPDKNAAGDSESFTVGGQDGISANFQWISAKPNEDEINEILGELYDLRKLINLVGDDEENNYEGRIEALKDELSEIAVERK